MNPEDVANRDVTNEAFTGPGNCGRRHRRHSLHQIRSLETFFMDYEKPSESQCEKLSQELGMTTKQIKSWFRYKRTQIKAQQEKIENDQLKAENKRLKMENKMLREALANSFCAACQGFLFYSRGGARPLSYNIMLHENLRLRNECLRLQDLVNEKKGGRLG
ncbi:OLC1v1029885C1 [Oldenlandia corymbosa var. corymbosa]|uniref:OLC1v1029885C1 n=1 Tax=Oldenlandia corymbosa var. corymbosa TaxID=529605 RepID=A0AAV1CFR1_OLDCO|nr:OLC1v1029885C1 [Oldenlandia corymbosa var. corymbosa]